MRTLTRIFSSSMALMFIGLFPLVSVNAKSIQFRHLISIYSDDKDVPLKQPEGVACRDSSRLIVADTGNGRLLEYTFENKVLKSKGTDIKPPQLSYPVKAEINSKGEIYVLDGKQRRVICLTPKGEFKSYLDPQRLPAPTAYVPRSFSIDAKDNIYILDIFSKRVLMLSPAGEYQKHIGFPKEYGFFSDLTVDGKGKIFIIDSVNARVYSAGNISSNFSPFTGRLNEYVRYPTAMTADDRGRIFLVDRNGGRVIIQGLDGSFLGRHSAMGWKEGFLNYPSQICINAKGDIFIADTNNNRIQIFTTSE